MSNLGKGNLYPEDYGIYGTCNCGVLCGAKCSCSCSGGAISRVSTQLNKGEASNPATDERSPGEMA